MNETIKDDPYFLFAFHEDFDAQLELSISDHELHLAYLVVNNFYGVLDQQNAELDVTRRTFNVWNDDFLEIVQDWMH